MEGREKPYGHLMVASTPTIDPRLRELLFFASSFIAPISAWYDREHTHKGTTLLGLFDKAWFCAARLEVVYLLALCCMQLVYLPE